MKKFTWIKCHYGIRLINDEYDFDIIKVGKKYTIRVKQFGIPDYFTMGKFKKQSSAKKVTELLISG
jgi:hypothetical protein